MIRKALGAPFLSATILIPFSASAQGVPDGVERGAREGERAVGPEKEPATILMLVAFGSE
jgi:hypothetical protein